MPAAADAPLGLGEFAGCIEALGPFERRPALAVAVSGGPDSMALVLLAHDWVAARGGSLLALIVDHGLRAESAAEAALTAGRLAEAGIESRVLCWEGPKPATGIQAAAREARYRLLQLAAHAAGVLHLLLAHHADDQAETVALRLERGSGRRGQAGMPAIREVEGLRLLRPLLGVAKARLVATLRHRGVAWIEDPSNRDLRFARAKLRAQPRSTATQDLGNARAAEDRELAAFMAARARPHPLGFVRLDLAGLDRLPAFAIERIVLTVAGGTLPPRRERLSRLVESLSAGDATATLSGCILRRRGDGLLAMREPRAASEVVELAAGQTCRWDGRFRISLAADAGAGTLRRLGADGRSALDAEARRRAREVPAMVQLGLPSLWRCGELAWHPFAVGDASRGMPGAVRCGFLPPMGLAEAPFVPANVVSNATPLIYRQG